ncbi:unnamed protein product [Durusdinium trenchii]|uniref:ribose-phosphate diphosphokinase n=1 Tax=Durusdinium trenchii TaxID=1381693 RepID=A0ABP0L7Z8_9DINO
MPVQKALDSYKCADRSQDEDDGPEDAFQSIRIPLGHPPVLFGLPGSEELMREILSHLKWRFGECAFQMFDNGEIGPKILHTVANHDVFVVIARNDAMSELNFSLMRLLLTVDALRGESPHRLTVVMPCLEYARQDRKLVAGEAIAPKLLLRCIRTAGATRVLTVDLHNQAEAAFSPTGMVLDELSSDVYLADFIKRNVTNFDEDHTVVCATNGMADILRVGFIMADRFRQQGGGRGDVKIISDSELKAVSTVIVIDDMFDTCGNLVEVCSALHLLLPKADLYGVAPHGYFSGDAGEKVKGLVQDPWSLLYRSGTDCNLQWLAVTNSVDQTAALQRLAAAGLESRIKVIEISKLLAGAIARLHLGAPVNVSKFKSLGPKDIDPATWPKRRQTSADIDPARCCGRTCFY